MKRYISVLVFAGAALAQGDTIPVIDLAGWMSNIALFAAGLASLVHIVREPINRWLLEREWGYQFDGKWRVFVLGALLGMIIGGIGQALGYLTAVPFASWTRPFGGLAYGIVAAGIAFLGVNFVDLLSSRNAKAANKATLYNFVDLSPIADGLLLLLSFFFPGVSAARLAPFLSGFKKILEQSSSPALRNAQFLAEVSRVKKLLGIPETIIEV